MRAGFYPKLAWNGITKNKRFYLPYILTCVGMVSMFYIVSFLSTSPLLLYMPGSETVSSTLNLGSWVIGAFSLLFLFYTNSFLMKRRKKEFGLYNILGMGKWNIGRILFWETIITVLISFVCGAVFGIALSKLAELCLVNVIRGDVDFSLTVSSDALISTLTLFSVIFLLIFLNDIRQIKFTNPAELLRSENAGEKPPKANWFLGIVGVLLLGGAYYIAITIEDPVSALVLFFVAVLMVIVGTYLVFISGSVMFCRILQKRKKYYYKPNHFISVSSMVYRMKRNGAGLASICILATMVLVMISSTASLYFGSESSLAIRYPRDFTINVNFMDIEDMNDENISSVRDSIGGVAEDNDASQTDVIEYRWASVSGLLDGNEMETDVSNVDFTIDMINFIPLSDYNRMMNKNETLEEDEVLVHTVRSSFDEDNFIIKQGNSFEKIYNVKNKLSDFTISGDAAMGFYPSVYIVVPDFASAVAPLSELLDYNGNEMVSLRWFYGFNTDVPTEKHAEMETEIFTAIGNVAEDIESAHGFSCESREEESVSYYSTFGGLFFLGALLSVVFIFAAVLIIYYKQTSEGYEDQARFEIMQKVGMTKKEIRKSINSQLLTVFFLPLIFSAMHLAFSFPIIRKILLLFNLNDVFLFAVTTVICFICFALLYTFVYRITSNSYYAIVSGQKRRRNQ